MAAEMARTDERGHRRRSAVALARRLSPATSSISRSPAARSWSSWARTASGKSVTLETIAGFHRPDAGRVLIGGRDVTRPAAGATQRRLPGAEFRPVPAPQRRAERGDRLARRPRRAVPPAAALPHGDLGALLGYFGVAHLARRTPANLEPRREAARRTRPGACRRARLCSCSTSRSRRSSRRPAISCARSC